MEIVCRYGELRPEAHLVLRWHALGKRKGDGLHFGNQAVGFFGHTNKAERPAEVLFDA